MEFDKVRSDRGCVELLYKTKLEPEGVRDSADHGKDPTPAFKAALQAFAGYVCWVHSWPESAADRIEIRQVTIKRPEDTPRGIIVTALLKCPRARNSTSTINTPYLAEPPEGYAGERTGFLPESTVQLIDALEVEAEKFHNGERGEQTSLKLETSENAKDFDQRAAAASAQSTRKGKVGGKKNQPRQADTGVAIIANPDAGDAPFTDAELRQLLLQVERDVPVDAIAQFTSSERLQAEAWARARQREILGTLKEQTVPAEPPCLLRSATMPLKAEEWTSDPPPKISDEQAVEIHTSVEQGVAAVGD